MQFLDISIIFSSSYIVLSVIQAIYAYLNWKDEMIKNFTNKTYLQNYNRDNFLKKEEKFIQTKMKLPGEWTDKMPV
jgi:hypothetical protein